MQMSELNNIDSKKSFSVAMKVFVLFTLLFVFPAFSQKEKPQNYRRFDEKLVHFGFMLGANTANFNVVLKPDAYSTYGLKSLIAKSSIGGQVGIVSTLKLGTPVVRLRMIPT